MKMTTHELARLLLSEADQHFSFGHFVTNCGESWWERVEDIEVVFGEEGCVLEECFDGS